MKQRRANFQPQLRRKVHHISDAGELYVREVSLFVLFNQWKEFHVKTKLQRAEAYYIECNTSGQINWQTARVYTSSELVGRNNVKIISFEQ